MVRQSPQLAGLAMSGALTTVTDAVASRRSTMFAPVTTRAAVPSRSARAHPRCRRRVGAEVARAAGTPIRGGGDKRRAAMQRLVAASAAPGAYGFSTTHATIPNQFDLHRPVAAPYEAPQPQYVTPPPTKHVLPSNCFSPPVV